jgi:hypothetical protein
LKRRLKDGSGNPRRLISYFHVAHDDGKILVTAFAAHFKDLLGQAPLAREIPRFSGMRMPVSYATGHEQKL